MTTTKLSVNIDHVATVREARGVDYPSPLAAARLALEASADGITVHLRGDRRHIQDADVVALRRELDTHLNLEIAAEPEMIAFAVEHRPDQVSLVPERPEEITTEGGLDLTSQGSRATAAARELAAAGIHVSLFIDPEPHQIELIQTTAEPSIRAIELNTDAYTRAGDDAAAAELGKLATAAILAAQAGLAVYAGHGLTVANVGPVAALPEVEELNIGHAIVSRAVLIGMNAAVAEMRKAIAKH